MLRWTIVALCLLAVTAVWAQEAPNPVDQLSPTTLTVDKVFGEYTFWRQTDAGYESGFIEFLHDHTWSLVTHLDKDRDRVTDNVEIKKGTFAEARREDGTIGIYIEGEGLPREFLQDLRIVGNRAKTFIALGRSFTVRTAEGPYFILENNRPDMAKALTVESDPAGAIVYLDGQQQEGATPLTIKKPRANLPLEILVTKPGFAGSRQTVTLKIDEEMKIEVRLLQGEGGLRITCLPPVKVKVDGKFMGVTPLTVENLSVGQHKLELYNETLGINEVQTITLEKGQILKKNFRYQGRMVVDVGRHCRIERLGRKVGETPFDGDVPIGRHVLILIDDRGERRQLLVDIEAEKTLTIKKAFDSLPEAE